MDVYDENEQELVSFVGKPCVETIKAAGWEIENVYYVDDPSYYHLCLYAKNEDGMAFEPEIVFDITAIEGNEFDSLLSAVLAAWINDHPYGVDERCEL